MRKTGFLVCLVVLLGAVCCALPPRTIPAPAPQPGPVAVEDTPQRFMLNFRDAYLVYVPATQTLQVTAAGYVLATEEGWEVRQLKPFLYHLRLRTWRDFYWKVNTDRREIWEVTRGEFGQLGGVDKIKPFTVEEKRATPGQPFRFFVRFPQSYLLHEPPTGVTQITAGGTVLSYGRDWRVEKLKPYLYHLKRDGWRDFFWKVNTNRKAVWKVENAAFGQLGGLERELPISVRVVQAP